MTKFLLAGILMAALAPLGLHAAEEVTAAAGYAFPSIQQGGGARAIGLGSSYVGVAEGSTALMWNPAGLGDLQAAEISLHHNSALLGAVQEMVALGLPLGYGQGLGLSLNFEDNGVFDGRDSNGLPTASYSARSFGGSAGWGMSMPAGLQLGFALKFNHRELSTDGDNAFAGDLGLKWSPSHAFSVGAAYTNLGPDVAGRQIAQGLRVGLASYLGHGSDHEWLLAISGESLTFGEQSAHMGLEHTFYQTLALRAGYAFNIPRPETSGLLGWTFGGGIAFKQLVLDYAFVPLADLGNMQRVSLSYAFNDHSQKNSQSQAPQPAPAKPVAVAQSAPPPPLQTPTPAPAKPLARIETVLVLTDADFKRVVAHGEAELISAAAIARIDRALTATLGDENYLRVIGETKIHGAADEMREIGSRRANLVRGYLVKKSPPSRIVKAVTSGDRDGALSGIFQVVVR